MKSLSNLKTILGIVTLIILSPAVTMADPADPGGDPYATPVNGGVAFVAAIAFLYGVYRIYQQFKKNSAEDSNR